MFAALIILLFYLSFVVLLLVLFSEEALTINIMIIAITTAIITICSILSPNMMNTSVRFSFFFKLYMTMAN